MKKISEFQDQKFSSFNYFLGGIAHEMNNPLTGILVFSQMILRSIPQDNPLYQDAVEVEKAALRCRELTHELLEFSEIAGKNFSKKNKKTSVDVNAIAKSAIKFSSLLPQARLIRIHENFTEMEGFVFADQNQLIQIFLNLIQNAYQAMPKGGEIFFKSYQEEQDSKLHGVWEIKDTGQGISPDEEPYIFEPFYTTKKKGEGSGLGLSLSLHFCKSIGGNLELLKSSPGKGSLFRMTLPLVKC